LAAPVLGGAGAENGAGVDAVLRRVALRLIEGWQANQNRPRGLCLHRPTCSAYGHRAISERGFFVGGLMTAWRVLRSNGCTSSSAPTAAAAPVADARDDGRDHVSHQ